MNILKFNPTPHYNPYLESPRQITNLFWAGDTFLWGIMLALSAIWHGIGVTDYFLSNFWLKYLIYFISIVGLIVLSEYVKEAGIDTFEKTFYILIPFSLIVSFLLSTIYPYYFIVCLMMMALTYLPYMLYSKKKKFIPIRTIFNYYLIGLIILIILCIFNFNGDLFVSTLIFFASGFTFVLYNDLLYGIIGGIAASGKKPVEDENTILEFAAKFILFSSVNFTYIFKSIFSPNFVDTYNDYNNL